MVIDFGNGISCDTTGPTAECPAGLLEDDHGLDVPDFEMSVTENGIGDGGQISGTRTPTRRMSIPVDHGGTWTRYEIMRAFTPNVERTIFTERGSMPYYVEALLFPKNMQEAQRHFTVVIASPWAYPLGAIENATVLDFTTVTHETGAALESMEYAPDGHAWFFETITLADDGSIADFGPWMLTPTVGTIHISLFNTSGGLPSTIIGEEEHILVPASATPAHIISARSVDLPAGTYAVVWRYFYTLFAEGWRSYVDYAAGFAGGVGGIKRTAGTWAAGAKYGGSFDTTVDFRFSAQVGAASTAPSTVIVASETDVLCAPIITCTLAGADTELVVSDGTRTTTITHAFVADDVVVIDSASHTVTINGANAIADFDRDGDWPMIAPGTTTLALTPAVNVSMSWRPRLMGLI